MTRHLAILATHPVQYLSPFYRLLSAQSGLDVEVWYCHRANGKDQADAGFGVEFEWDGALYDGYSYRFLQNMAKRPSASTFQGIDTPEIGSLIRGSRLDALLVSGWHYKSAWQAIRSCWQSGTPLMLRGDSHLRTARPWAKRLAKYLPYRYFISRADACLAVGERSAEYFRFYGAKPERLFFAPHAVEESFSALPPIAEDDRKKLRERWQLDPNATVFVFVGKFIHKKRPLDFLRGIEFAVKSGARIAGLMVGDGPLRAECQQFVEQKGLPVRFTGFLNRSEITMPYIAADALVLASDGEETWGLVVNEAMELGRPCILSSEVGCGPDLIRAGETGFIYRLGDIEHLGCIMKDCSQNTGLLARMGRNARARMSRYSHQEAVNGVLEALAAVKSSK